MQLAKTLTNEQIVMEIQLTKTLVKEQSIKINLLGILSQKCAMNQGFHLILQWLEKSEGQEGPASPNN